MEKKDVVIRHKGRRFKRASVVSNGPVVALNPSQPNQPLPAKPFTRRGQPSASHAYLHLIAEQIAQLAIVQHVSSFNFQSYSLFLLKPRKLIQITVPQINNLLLSWSSGGVVLGGLIPVGIGSVTMDICLSVQ